MASADSLERKLAYQRAQAKAKAPTPAVVKPQVAPTVARAAIASIATAKPSAQTAQARSASTPTVAQRSSASTAKPTRGLTYTDANGFVNTWNPRLGIYEVTGKVAVAAKPPRGQTYTDEKTGFVYNWNAKSGVYEVTRTVATPTRGLTYTENGLTYTWNPNRRAYEVTSNRPAAAPAKTTPVTTTKPPPKNNVTDKPALEPVEEEVQTSYQFDNAPGSANVAALTTMAQPAPAAAPAAAQSALANRTVTQAVGRGSTITDRTPSGITNMTTSPFFQTYNKRYPRFNLQERG